MGWIQTSYVGILQKTCMDFFFLTKHEKWIRHKAILLTKSSLAYKEYWQQWKCKLLKVQVYIQLLQIRL
jgi:hypothetical protein